MLTGFQGEANINGVKPFADPNDFSTIQQPFFDRVERVIMQADSLGLLLAIAPLWAGCCGEGFGGKGAVGPTSFISTNGPVKAKEFGEYIARRFSKYNNIIWIMGGDIDPFEDKESIESMANAIKAVAPHQLITYHASSSHSSTDVWDNPAWLDISLTYTYFRGFNKAWTQDMPDVYEVNFREYNKQPVRPYFLGESTYEGEHGVWGSATQIRKQAYWSALTGGFGHGYGTPMWNFPANWKGFLNLPGGNSLQHFVDLFGDREWYDMIPDSTSSIIVKGSGIFGKNDFAVAASEKSGRWIIAYIPSGRNIEIDCARITGKTLKASWYNPRDGRYTIIGKSRVSKRITLKTPDDQDWVVVIEREQ